MSGSVFLLHACDKCRRCRCADLSGLKALLDGTAASGLSCRSYSHFYEQKMVVLIASHSFTKYQVPAKTRAAQSGTGTEPTLAGGAFFVVSFGFSVSLLGLSSKLRSALAGSFPFGFSSFGCSLGFSSFSGLLSSPPAC